MNKPVHVNINNVARWFFEENEKEVWELKDFPCLAVPWPMAVFVYRMPRFFNSEGERKPLPIAAVGRPMEVATAQVELEPEHRTAVPIAEGWVTKWLSEATGIKLIPVGDHDSNVRQQLMEAESRPPAFLTLFMFRFMNQSVMTCCGYLDSQGRNIGPFSTVTTRSADEALAADLGLFYPVFMAVSMLHCKNIKLIDEPISRQVRRKRERKGQPFYKTLVIEPLKTQVRNESAGEGGSEIQRALHICRGNFATYTDAAPLFGKLTGTFWRPMHVKGNRAAGQVIKDYAVKP